MHDTWPINRIIDGLIVSLATPLSARQRGENCNGVNVVPVAARTFRHILGIEPHLERVPWIDSSCCRNGNLARGNRMAMPEIDAQ